MATSEQVLNEDTKPVEHTMNFKVMMVTPVMAAELLKNNHPNNRRPKWNKISQYATDIRSGMWKLTHQGIAIDRDGWLVDGQNRLQAIVEADKGVPLVVVTGVPAKAMVSTDTMAARTVVDAARVAGKAFGKSETSYASTAKYMMSGFGPTLRPSHQEIINFAQRHKQALDFVFEVMPRMIRGITSSPVRAAIARAWYRRNSRNRLRGFCQGLTSGLVDDVETDASVIKLRNWLVTTAMNVGGERSKIYAKTEHALAAFLEGGEYDRLGQVKQEQFPIPDDPSLNPEDGQ